MYNTIPWTCVDQTWVMAVLRLCKLLCVTENQMANNCGRPLQEFSKSGHWNLLRMPISDNSQIF